MSEIRPIFDSSPDELKEKMARSKFGVDFAGKPIRFQNVSRDSRNTPKAKH